MKTNFRNYKLLKDFSMVCDFLSDNYDPAGLNGYLLPQFFEYAHTHPYFSHRLTHRFGLWEDGYGLAAIACYEFGIGEAFLCAKKGYEELLPDMLSYAESELSILKDGRYMLEIWITDKLEIHKRLLSENGYKKVHSEPVKIFSYENDFKNVRLPAGFTSVSLVEESDYFKINECLWKGFDHGDEPDNDIDGRRLMQSGPCFRPDLATIIKAPDGKYACYAGMWLDEKNGYAYLEPLATVPQYRRMGLASFALTESMKKTKALGAGYCFGGVREFYDAIGFQTICQREKWRKEW